MIPYLLKYIPHDYSNTMISTSIGMAHVCNNNTAEESVQNDEKGGSIFAIDVMLPSLIYKTEEIGD